MTHAYDNPDLDDLQFLRAVRNDTSVPLHLRVKAAQAVMPYTTHAPEPVQVNVTHERNVLQ